MVERKSRYMVAAKLESKKAEHLSKRGINRGLGDVVQKVK